ncbi:MULTISPECIES: hypothetical protein [unclassified Shewanella]|nr:MULTISPECIES: hypothetical protein [unclassified Shewanella]
MTAETASNLDEYAANFQSANKEQNRKLCDVAIKFARVSDFGK